MNDAEHSCAQTSYLRGTAHAPIFTKSLAACFFFGFTFVVPLYGHDQPPTVKTVPPPAMMPQAVPSPAEAGTKPSIEKISPGVFRIGQVTINKNEHSISFPAQVNMTKGLLEYLLVRAGGKTHESLFRTAIEPYNLQIACLLLGIEGTTNPLAFQGAAETPTGDRVEITLNYKDNEGKTVTARPEAWLTQIIENTKHETPSLQLVYTGSIVNNGRFMAQVEGSIIALYHDPVAMFDSASPGGESDKVWFVNEKTVPPVGTPVTVTIKAAK